MTSEFIWNVKGSQIICRYRNDITAFHDTQSHTITHFIKNTIKYLLNLNEYYKNTSFD